MTLIFFIPYCNREENGVRRVRAIVKIKSRIKLDEMNQKYLPCASCLNRLSGSNYKDAQHVDIRVLSEDVGFSMMLEMSMIPPVGRRSLKKQSFNINEKKMKKKYDREITFRWPMANLCNKWFQRDFLKTDRWPKSCCSHPACDYRQR